MFSGSVEDLKQIVLLELYKLCKDRNFAPETNHDIYAKLKYNTMKILGIDIAVSAYAESDIRIDENGEEYSLFEEYSLLEDYLDSNETPENILFRNPKYKYIGIMAEIVELLRKHDVKSLLRQHRTMPPINSCKSTKSIKFCNEQTASVNLLAGALYQAVRNFLSAR